MNFSNSRVRGVKLANQLPVDKSEKEGVNPPVIIPDMLTPKARVLAPPPKVPSPAKSAIRGQMKDDKPITNADILAFLKQSLGK